MLKTNSALGATNYLSLTIGSPCELLLSLWLPLSDFVRPAPLRCEVRDIDCARLAWPLPVL